MLYLENHLNTRASWLLSTIEGEMEFGIFNSADMEQ